MSEEILRNAPKPDHVPDELVFDFDLWNLPGGEDDIHLAMRAFQQSCPDIFWTPRNGGHWVATRAEDIEVMQRDYRRFSNHNVVIPKKPEEAPRMVPEEIDPPRLTQLRRPLVGTLLPKFIDVLVTWN